MNVSMPIAAVMLDLGFASAAVKVGADPCPYRGPARHLAEERDNPWLPHGRACEDAMRTSDDAAAEETLPWEEQQRQDDVAFRAQLAYLHQRSPFDRAKLAGTAAGPSPTSPPFR